MLGVAMYTTIKTLTENGLNKAQIARATRHDWKTVSKVINKLKSGQEAPDKKPHPRILDPFNDKVIEWIELGLNGVRIHQELVKLGIKVAYPTVKKFISAIKSRDNIFVRIHTAPAEEAQVDFGYVGYTPDNNGKNRKTWVFGMRLSYSRKDFFKKVYNQRVETFIECHRDAFNFFGGIPDCVRIDNLKAAILETNFYAPVYQKLYKNFSDHYGFKIIPCRIYRPNDKGKIEAGIKYVKNNFFKGRVFTSEDDVDRQLLFWLNNTCNARLHGTTRRIPQEVFDSEEKHKLKPLPLEDFKMSEYSSRKVYHDCHVFVDYNYYSVPFDFIGKEVDIELSKTLLKIYHAAKEIAVHSRLSGRGQFSTNQSHYPKYKRYSDTENQEKYQIKMADVGPFAEQLFFIFMQKQPTDWARSVQGILSLTKTYQREVVDVSCKRAIAFGAYQYQTVKNICSNGSYLLPTEFNLEEVHNHEYA